MQRNLATAVIAAGLCLLATGCGDQLRTKGRVTLGGQPLIPAGDDSVRVTFVPILPDGKPPADHYFAEFNRKDATFRAAGKDKKGMPAGKYRVAVEYKKNRRDLFNGKYDENRSPFVFDVNSGTPELVIDLEAPPKR